MKNFYRAIKQATKFWPSLVLAAACSFGVAALWGANIGAFYPILEVTIRGKSMQQWLADETASVASSVTSLEQKRSAQMLLLDQAAEEQLGEAQMAVAELDNKLAAERAKLAGYQRMKPWVNNWVPSSPFQTIALIVVALMVSTLIKHVFLIGNEFLVGRVALDLSRSLRGDLFNKAIRMDRAGYASIGTGNFLAQITHTTDMLSNGLMAALGAAMREPLKIFTCLLGAGLICWRLLLLSVVVAPLVGGLLVFVTRKLRGISQNLLGRATSFHEVMHESLGNLNTIQTFRTEEREEARFADATLMMRRFGLSFIFFSSLSKPIIEFLGIGMLSTTIIGGAYIVLNQETQILGIPICEEPLTVSALLVFFGFLIGISDPLRKLSAVYSSIYAGTIAADGIYGILDRTNAITDPENPKNTPSPHRMLELKNVDFGYLPEQEIISDVNLEIPFGSTIAVVGHNGSGKSTLINLLCRFYDPIAGSVQVDGIDLREMKIEDVRKRIALVNQQTELFNESVAFNIRYGRPDATDEEVEFAAREAHAHEFITTALENGYETKVGQNGQRLSGGQRQRIALARALLCDPEILILDEATSQIDMRSEQLIRESLTAHRGERTMIIITHREKLLELADRVYEVKAGRIIEETEKHQKAA